MQVVDYLQRESVALQDPGLRVHGYGVVVILSSIIATTLDILKPQILVALSSESDAGSCVVLRRHPDRKQCCQRNCNQYCGNDHPLALAQKPYDFGERRLPRPES